MDPPAGTFDKYLEQHAHSGGPPARWCAVDDHRPAAAVSLIRRVVLTATQQLALRFKPVLHEHCLEAVYGLPAHCHHRVTPSLLLPASHVPMVRHACSPDEC